MASPLMRVPETLKPYVVKLVQLYRLKQVEDELRAIDTAKSLNEAIELLRPTDKAL